MAYPYTLDNLMRSIIRRGAIPNAQMTFLPEDFQEMANEELLTYVLPTLVKLRQDYYMSEISLDPQTPDKLIGGLPAFRLPHQATASTIRDVQGIGPNGSAYPIGKIKLDDIPNMVGMAWFLYGEFLVLSYTAPYVSSLPQSLRVIYEARPNKLVYEADAFYVESVSANTLFCLGADAAPFSGDVPVNLISGNPGFNTIGSMDTLGIPVAAPYDIDVSAYPDIYSQARAGDWVCREGESTIPQIPVEMHPFLAQRVAVKFLEAQGETEQLQAAVNILQGMEERIPILIQPRVEGKPTKLVPRVGLWRRWRW